MNPNDVAPALVGSLFFLSFAAVLVLRGPLGKAWAKRIEGAGGQVDARVFPAVEELQGRVAELEERVQRMHELEERLDFAERLLAQGRDAVQLPAPRDRM
jgi:hypothetical protein